jgi:DNA-binding transcriptional regulator GbsR (MarR family)
MSDQTRRQVIRDAVREMLPQVLDELLKQEAYKSIAAKVEERLTEVEKYVKGKADLMDVRQKEILKFLVETHTKYEPAPEAPKKEE